MKTISFRLLACVLLSLLPACGGGGGGSAPPSPPSIVISDSTVPADDGIVLFGILVQGTTTTRAVSVHNAGQSGLVVGSVASVDPLAAPFSLSGDTCSNQTIVSGATCTLVVSLDLATPGQYSDSFDIPSNDPLQSAVTVTVSGLVRQHDTWVSTSTSTVAPARAYQSAVWTGTEFLVWGGFDSGIGGRTDTGVRYDPVSDVWTAMSTTGAPSPRDSAHAVWTGTEMIVWGGHTWDTNLWQDVYLRDGARYDPAADLWTAMSNTNAPVFRESSAVWTGTEMIVWGGYDGGAVNTGARYDPEADIWTPTATASAPTARNQHTAVWTGTDMIVWGGYTGGWPGDGGRYNPQANTWSALSTANTPSGRSYATAVWTGTQMIVWGGLRGGVYMDTGGKYDPAGNTWSTMTTTNTPTGRWQHTAVWTGTEMIVWGGETAGSVRLDTGGKYDPAGDVWTATSTTNAPSARAYHSAGWTGSEMLIWGGYPMVNPGGKYAP